MNVDLLFVEFFCLTLYLLLRLGRVVKYCDEYVCLLFVYSHISKIAWPNFTKFLCMLLVAMARSSSDRAAVRDVLPVLWMTSCFYTMGSIGRIMQDVMFRRSSLGGATVRCQSTTVFS